MKVKTKITARLSFIIEMPSFWILHFKRKRLLKEKRTERKEREIKQKRSGKGESKK